MLKKILLSISLLAAMLATSVPAFAEEPIKIAFVDTGNTGRSLTADFLATQMIAQQKLPIAVISRGVDVDPFDIHPEANAAILLKQHGIDVSGHLAAQLTANDIRHADVILTMTAKHKAKIIEIYPEAKDKVSTIAEFATGSNEDVADAYGKPIEIYEKMFSQVNGYLPSVLAKTTKK